MCVLLLIYMVSYNFQTTPNMFVCANLGLLANVLVGVATRSLFDIGLYHPFSSQIPRIKKIWELPYILFYIPKSIPNKFETFYGQKKIFQSV